MFGIESKNPLKQIVFSDGRINSVHAKDGEVVLEFVDYSDSLVKIEFLGVTKSLICEDASSMEIMDARFDPTGDTWVACLRDDDGQTALQVWYQTAVATYSETARN